MVSSANWFAVKWRRLGQIASRAFASDRDGDVLQWRRAREGKMRADGVVIARSHRASRDARLSTGCGDAAIQSRRSGPSSLDRFAHARDDNPGSTKSHHAIEVRARDAGARARSCKSAVAASACVSFAFPELIERHGSPARSDSSHHIPCSFPVRSSPLPGSSLQFPCFLLPQ